MAVTLAVPRETHPGERRVACVPEVVARLSKAGHSVRVESGAGEGSYLTDDAFAQAGAKLVADNVGLYSGAQIVLRVNAPTPEDVARMDPGAIVVGFLGPGRNLPTVRAMRERKITGYALELVPRISRAQSMDALSSQATVGGYVAALLGASECPKFLPMLTTAAGTIRPARVLILGAGVAGLMAIATARRLGAIVEAYDVRRAAGEQVRSLGAKFLELAINAEGAGGYARELTSEEKVQEGSMVSKAVAEADVVITTANVPGRRAPRLVSQQTVALMRPGSVVVDLAAESGGNCELTRPGETVVDHGVKVLGPLNLPSRVPLNASQMYARNLQSFLELLLTKDGQLVSDRSDEILVASCLVQDGEVRHAPTREALGASG
ncbi:MAG: Re/Si-specific NAD(P)(+) transhydrogenase subunit alpha [Thermoplasmata archaeon]|nr:Re/Si-specific NAD(P)(+) transhydrogenase subunit alpha [Thermoplasmata archaeon]MCI4341526.1 Re/Si-specific NAD(P)(+) transhydrogenase subunit alpha [Thermoplasmata archaeon]